MQEISAEENVYELNWWVLSNWFKHSMYFKFCSNLVGDKTCMHGDNMQKYDDLHIYVCVCVFVCVLIWAYSIICSGKCTKWCIFGVT